MTFNPASFSTIRSISQCLLNSIESENTPFLPAGFFTESPWESVKDLDFDELRECISKTFDLLKQQIFEVFALICRRRSSFLPIHRLPPEILSASISHSMAEIEFHNHQRRLIQLSTVSWWWRQVTLSTPSLWSVICSKDPEWIVSLALERSKDAPLTILYEGTSYSSNLHGGKSNRESMGSDDFLRLVSPHTARWADVTVPQLGSGHDNVEWLSQHPIQLSQHLRQLNLDWHGSPSTDNTVTRFSGRTGCLLDLKLRNLHVVPTEIFHILAAARRMVSLDLESLVASVRQEYEDEPNNTSPPMIDLPCLKRLALKGLPSSIVDPIVQHLNPSALDMASIDHNLAVQGDPSIPSTHPDPFASFTARLVATRTWTEIQIQSNGISLKPCAGPIRNFAIRLEGERVAILGWLRLRSLPQITREYSLQLDISSDSLGENPEQMLIDNLMRFSNVGSVVLWGRRESQRWIWLLSLPDAVQADLVDSKSDKPIRSWLWPGLCYLRFKGDYVNEFTILSVLLARYGSRPAEGAGAPSRFVRLDIRPGENVWRAEVLDRIKELVGPSCAVKWVKPQ